MRKKLYDIGILVLLITIGVVVYGRFIASGPGDNPVDIKGIESLKIYDTSGTSLSFPALLENGEANYLLIFAMNDCYSCIYKGIQDLVQLKKDGKSCSALVIHERVDEVEGWGAKQDFSPFFMIKKTDFYEHIKTPVTPLVVKIEDGRVQSYRFIKP